MNTPVAIEDPSAGPVLVHGIAAAGAALARALVRRGYRVILSDDTERPEHRDLAAALDARLVSSPTDIELAELIDASVWICPSPGVPLATHPIFRLAAERNKAIVGELDLAAVWDHRPVLAVTGTDGKTTTTTLIAGMMNSERRTAMAVGNTEIPLVEALDGGTDVFVVEASSFRLRFCERFSPRAAVWLNFAPDHLNWHTNLDDYRDAKARIWAHQSAGDVAIGNAADAVVMSCLSKAPGRRVTFGAGGDFRAVDGWLVGPDDKIIRIADMPRAFPHDVENALAASATALAGGASLECVREVLGSFTGLEHRMAFAGEVDGVKFYNDSKGTSPHAVLTALRSFDRVVLIAGGRNKGLDLSELADEASRVKAVVAIGEAGAEVAHAFEGHCPVTTASSMAGAVSAAHQMALPGTPVLLSPACTSYDWYRNYQERGIDFERRVAEFVAASSGGHE